MPVQTFHCPVSDWETDKALCGHSVDRHPHIVLVRAPWIYDHHLWDTKIDVPCETCLLLMLAEDP
jgi:hypothetical protein